MAPGNVISGNRGPGITIHNTDPAAMVTSFNMVLGNLLGLNADGNAKLPNAGPGVVIDAAHNNLIGGTTAAQRNVISGNVGDGVSLRGAINNVVSGNYAAWARCSGTTCSVNKSSWPTPPASSSSTTPSPAATPTAS